MINNLQISGVHSTVNEEVRKYVQKKIGKLDKYMSKNARESLFVEVKLKQKKSKDKNAFECEVIMKLPKQRMTAHEDATTIFAAIDEVEDNLKIQLKKYKDTHSYSRVARHIGSRLKSAAKTQYASEF